MEPIPETVEAANELDPDEETLLVDLMLAAEEVRELVPDLVGISLGYLREGLTFTIVATDTDVAVLDAVQYLAGGPCVDAVHAERVLGEQAADLLGEQEWQLFAQATAAKAVRSSLTLPILTGGAVTGSVNLYGGSGGAFTGLHEEIAAVFGAWAPGAVANADLSFSTRREAQAAPQRLADRRAVGCRPAAAGSAVLRHTDRASGCSLRMTSRRATRAGGLSASRARGRRAARPTRARGRCSRRRAGSGP